MSSGVLPRFLTGQRLLIFARLIANGFLQVGVMVTLAFLIREVFDKWIVSTSQIHSLPLIWVGAGFLTCIVFAAALRYREKVDAEALGQSYIYEVRLLLFDHLSKMNQREFRNISKGGLMLRFVGDLSGLRQWLSLGLARLSLASIILPGTLGALAVANWQLACCVGVVLLTGCTASLLMGKHLQQTVKEARRRRGYLAGNINEKLAAMSVVQVFGQAGREYRRLSRQSDRLQQAMLNRASAIGLIRGGIVATTTGATATVLLVGAWLIEQKTASAGSVAAAISIVGMLAAPLMDLGRVYEYWQAAQIAKDKITELLKKPVLVERRRQRVAGRPDLPLVETAPPSLKGSIEFQKVNLGKSLHQFSAKVLPGQFVSIVGPNGAGKSTLLGLVARLIQPDSGKILINGSDIATIAQSSLSNQIGIVSPDLPLLKGSLRKNLKYRQPKALDRAMLDVMEKCGLTEMLSDFSQGIKISISEQGANLSLGQRHRLALARAILGYPSILLLDEVEANLDAEALGLVRNLLSHPWGSVLMVTHRKEMAALSDEIWYLEQGRLVDSGPTQKMLQGNGPISQFFNQHQRLAHA